MHAWCQVPVDYRAGIRIACKRMWVKSLSLQGQMAQIHGSRLYVVNCNDRIAVRDLHWPIACTARFGAGQTGCHLMRNRKLWCVLLILFAETLVSRAEDLWRRRCRYHRRFRLYWRRGRSEQRIYGCVLGDKHEQFRLLLARRSTSRTIHNVGRGKWIWMHCDSTSCRQGWGTCSAKLSFCERENVSRMRVTKA